MNANTPNTPSAISVDNELTKEPESTIEHCHSGERIEEEKHHSLINLIQALEKKSDSTSRFPKLGISLKDLHVYGLIPASDYLPTVATFPLQFFESGRNAFRSQSAKRIDILRNVDGLVKSGEMLAVLGRPGSGCTTFLKVIAGELNGIYVGNGSSINYDGALPKDMHGEFRSECTYTAELDVHFPELTVAETLDFAANTRSSKSDYVNNVKEELISAFNLSGAVATVVGNEIIRGVSGGEKKRLSIAEAMVGLSAIQCWDNSTRGMDSATALKIIHHFRDLATHRGATVLVSLYQASQRALDAFDKVTVLYRGQQIFFGTWAEGIEYFQSLGFQRPTQMTTGDFFTALTNPAEARHLVSEGMESGVPVTAEDFALRWRTSNERKRLLEDITRFDDACAPRNEVVVQMRKSRQSERDNAIRPSSPYNVTLLSQILLCLRRGFQRVKNNIALPISTVVGNVVIGLIIGSVFYNLGQSSDSLNRRTILLYFVTLLNGFMTGFEVMAVWAQRPIVEKHSKYGFHHPFTEAISAMLVDLPSKFFTSIFFNLVVYFMANLRRTPSAFFIYLLFSFTVLMTMSMFYRCIGSMSRTLQGSMVPIGIAIIFFIMYTGFVIPERYMHPWFSWTRFLNPIAFAFEALMINEFHGRTFSCNQFVPVGPEYNSVPMTQRICSSVGAIPGQNYVYGTKYLEVVFNYHRSHLWRNYGVLLVIMTGLCIGHIVSSEYILAKKSKGEVLLFLRGKAPSRYGKLDEEAKGGEPPLASTTNEKRREPEAPRGLKEQASTFCWDNLCYDIKADGKTKRLLTEVNGWVEPGTLTALMGATGAGKTTLLDVLSQRASIGVVSGKVCVNGQQRGPDFQRKTGYAQQMDVHLPTATVREALEFSALLRQPAHIPKSEKLAFVDEVIDVLEMQQFADAIVGVPGEGLNVEQRKRLTIGVEMAAKPELLLFLDEPTSGLDSQTAWTVCTLLRKLADHGQAILCTIHQPSSLLLQTFDKLLLIEKGGQTVYFGELGAECRTMVSYLESKGARSLAPNESAAEWMMEVTAPHASSIDWFQEWKTSTEAEDLKQQIARISHNPEKSSSTSREQQNEYAVSLSVQIWYLLHRTFVEYWRTPQFLWAKFLFSCGAAIAISFSCWKSPNSLQGIQSQLFAIFTFFTILSNLMQQIVVQFLERRTLFEAREGPSKTFSWIAFLISAAVIEALCQLLLALCTFLLFYYPAGMYLQVPSSQTSERAALMFLFFVVFLLFTSTFTHLLTAPMEHRETIVNIGSLLFYLTLIFCGVLVQYDALPGFWKFMYWMSPMTYLVKGMTATGVAGKPLTCSTVELLNLPIQGNTTCGEYLESFISYAGGKIINPTATDVCSYCPIATTDALFKQLKIEYSERWLAFGVLIIFVVFNILATFGVYWVARVPKRQRMVET